MDRRKGVAIWQPPAHSSFVGQRRCATCDADRLERLPANSARPLSHSLSVGQRSRIGATSALAGAGSRAVGSVGQVFADVADDEGFSDIVPIKVNLETTTGTLVGEMPGDGYLTAVVLVAE